jgi:phage-related protein
VRFAEVIYVLHAFQKKSTKGIKTSKADIAMIRARLRLAQEDHRARTNAND